MSGVHPIVWGLIGIYQSFGNLYNLTNLSKKSITFISLLFGYLSYRITPTYLSMLNPGMIVCDIICYSTIGFTASFGIVKLVEDINDESE